MRRVETYPVNLTVRDGCSIDDGGDGPDCNDVGENSGELHNDCNVAVMSIDGVVKGVRMGGSMSKRLRGEEEKRAGSPAFGAKQGGWDANPNR